MDKVKDFLSKLVGTSLISFAVRVLIALVSLYTGAATDAGDAIGQALDKDRSIAAAVQLINDTPQDEVVQAVIEEKKADAQ